MKALTVEMHLNENDARPGSTNLLQKTRQSKSSFRLVCLVFNSFANAAVRVVLARATGTYIGNSSGLLHPKNQLGYRSASSLAGAAAERMANFDLFHRR